MPTVSEVHFIATSAHLMQRPGKVCALASHQYSSWRRSSSINCDSAESSSGSASARFLLRLRGSVSAPISPTPSGSRSTQ